MMNKAQKTPPWISTAFHVSREFSINQTGSPLDVPEGLSTAPDEVSVSDFKRFADCNLTLGDVLGILLLCRALDGTPVNLFRRRAVTVIQSSLRSDYLARAIKAICPETHMVMKKRDPMSIAMLHKAVHLRTIPQIGLTSLDIEEIANIISRGECMIFRCDLEFDDLDETLPVPFNLLQLCDIDTEILGPLLAMTFPETSPELFAHKLGRLSSIQSSRALTADEALCACAGEDFTGAIDSLIKETQPPKAEAPEAYTPDVDKPVVPLDELVGYGKAKRAAKGLISSLRLYWDGKLAWDDVPRGLLLIGAPGTGKTELARAMAHDLGMPFISASFAKWQGNGHLGDMQRAMAKDFDVARKHKSCLFFIDEMDAFTVDNSGRNASYDQKVVKALIEQLDGIKGREGVVIVGAANDLDKIPPVIWRSGRIDQVIRIPLPDLDDLATIFRQHLKPSENDIDTAACAVHTVGRTGADCAGSLRVARSEALMDGCAMTTSDIINVLNGDLHQVAPEHLWRMAVHECGHAIVAASFDELSVDFIRLSASGGTCRTRGHHGYHTTLTLHRDRAISLAGRVAETLVFGLPSSGAGGNASSDLAKAMMAAANEIGAFGLGELGLLWLGEPNTQALLFEVINGNLPEISRLLIRSEEEARRILETQLENLEEMAQALTETGVLTGDRLNGFLRRSTPELQAR